MSIQRVFALALCVALAAGAMTTSVARVAVDAQRPATVLVVDKTSYVQSGELLMFVSNDGSFAYDRNKLLAKNDGLHYPRDCDKTVVFASGIWLGAKTESEVRTSCAEYSMDFAPGVLGGSYPPEDPHNQVYVIHKGDSRASNPDYADWPFEGGAPALKDHAGADSLDGEGFRIPLLKGDEASWAVFNDNDPAYRFSRLGTGSAGPLGIEVQLYTFCIDSIGSAGRTIFMEYTLINKAGYQLDSAYVGFWADPDIGNPGDDLVGCDSISSLGYTYNSMIDTVFGYYPPAVGVGLLNGPVVNATGEIALVPRLGGWVAGKKNLPMTSFKMYINGTDPTLSTHAYNSLHGLNNDGTPIIDPITSQPTSFMVSGDPVTWSGWLDANPGDRRQLVATGPFSMPPGDTQEVTIAVMVGSDYMQGCEHLRVDTVFATHTAGESAGRVIVLIVRADSTTGHDYRVVLSDATGALTWTLHDLTAGTTPIVDNPNFSGDDSYPVIDGMVVKVIGSRSGVGECEVPNGTQKFSWDAANTLSFEGFGGAIGWESPCHYFGYCPSQGVPESQLRRVLLKLAAAELDGTFSPSDPNVSYAHRYLRRANEPPARPEFAPFILNPETYGYQDFTQSVPLSAWDIDASPPRRLALGFFENNVVAGSVDGKYWPPADNAVSNSAPDGPREWLWIFDRDYAETPDPEFQLNILTNQMPVMYFLTVARDGDVAFSTGDEFQINPSAGPLTAADVFEFTAPDPVSPLTASAMPLDRLSSVLDLRLLDSLALVRYRSGITACSCPCHADPACDGVGPDIVDVAMIINVAFRGGLAESSGPCPTDNTDVDTDGSTNVLDVVKIVDVAFRSIPSGLRISAPCR